MRSHWILLVVIAILSWGCSHSTTKDKNVGYKGHGADSLPTQVLQKFAPKPLPTEELKRIQSMLDVRSTSLGTLSPNGKSLYVSWGVTGTRQIWKVSGPNSFPIQMTGGEDATRLHAVTPNGKYLIVSRDSKGDEYPGLYLQSTKGGPLFPIYKKKKVQVLFSFVSLDSKYVYYRANDKLPDNYTIYRYDIANQKIEEIYDNPKRKGYWLIADYKGADRLLLALWKGNTASEYYDFSIQKKEAKPLFGQDVNEEFIAKFGSRNDEVIVLTNKFEDFRRLYKWNKGEFKPITNNKTFDISSFSMDRNKTRIMYETNDKGYFGVKAIDAKRFRPIKAPSFKGNDILHVYYGSSTRSGRYTTLGVVKTNQPRASYVYDWRTGQTRQWVFPSSPEIDTSQFVVPRLESYPTRDGALIPMFVWRPKACENNLCPVVVNFHGGPESQAYPWFSPFIQLFNEQGFIFVSPNVRGSDGYGKKWLHSDNGPKRLKVITDIEDAARYIKKEWARSGKVPKVGIMGGSYGGYSTFVGMTMFAGAYDAGVAIVGMSSLLTFLQNTAPYRRKLRITEYGDPEKDREALLKLSPMTYLDQIKDPILIVHGATDPRVPAGEAVQVYKAMEKKGLPGELILFPDEGHGIRKRKNRAVYIGHSLRFFNTHLKK